MTTTPGRDQSGGWRACVYRSAIGRRAFWRASPLTAATLAYVGYVQTQPDVWGWPGNLYLLALAGAFALAACLFLGTSYRIEDGMLKVRMSFRRVDIPLRRIKTVRRRANAPLWRPGDLALGTAVIEIDDGGWKWLVSPRDEAGFLAELAKACPACAAPGCTAPN